MFQASQPVVGVGGYRRRSSGQGALCDPELDDSGNKLVARLEDDAFISEQDLVSFGSLTYYYYKGSCRYEDFWPKTTPKLPNISTNY